MLEIEYEVKEEDLIAFNEHQHKRDEDLQRKLTQKVTIIPAACFVIALIMWFYFHNSLATIFSGVVAFSWGFGLPLYQAWSRKKFFRNFYSEEDKAKVLGNIKLAISPKALIETTSQGETRMDWPTLLRVELTRRYAFIFVGMDSALIIPRKRVLQGNLQDFLKAAEKHIEASS